MVIFFTKAYNAEATLHRCVQSVLGQRHGDFIYYLCDNASTDGTWGIMQECAASDSRIRLLRNEQNIPIRNPVGWGNMKLVRALLDEHGEGHYYSVLDADDEYRDDFIEKMLAFISEHRLRAATCGTDWVDAKTGALVRRKTPPHNMVLEGRAFLDRYPEYRSFALAAWGSLCSLAVLKNCDFSQCAHPLTFHDTVLALEIFRNSGRAGVLADSLHKYYIVQDGSLCKYDPGWFLRCKNFLNYVKYYMTQFGELSKQNVDYLHVLYLILLKYILPRIQNADIGSAEKLKDIATIFSDADTRLLFVQDWGSVGITTDKAGFLREMKTWVEGAGTDELHDLVSQALSAIHAVERGF